MKLIGTILLLASTANADFDITQINQQMTVINQQMLVARHSSCVDEYMTLLSQKERVSKPCHVSLSLTMQTTSHYYPNLNSNPRTVQYWVGIVSKTVVSDRTYLRELVDHCHGKIISSMKVDDSTAQDQDFTVENPNLEDTISESFLLSPMSGAQAKRALVSANQECLKN